MFAAISPTLGTQPFNDWFVPDTTQRQPLGMKVTAVDPYWGFGEFIYIKSNDAILKGSLVAIGTAPTYLGTLLPSTAGQGFPFGVAMNAIPSGSYGWLQISGAAVIKTNATVAADTAIAVAAAGIAGTLANGKQLLNTRNVKAATATVTVTAQTTNGNGILVTAPGYDGFFLGMALSGTGIPASTVVAALSPDGRTIYTGSAIGTTGDKNSTATGSITLTGTYTGFGQAQIAYPFAQGQIL
jgi:hypothetical protein